MYFILEDNPKEMYLIKERFNTLKEAQKRARELTNPFCNYYIVKKEFSFDWEEKGCWNMIDHREWF